MEIEAEVWVPIVGFEKSYMISSWGNVKRIKSTIQRKNGRPLNLREKTLKFLVSKQGYYRVMLYKESVHKSARINILVAKHFIENTFNKPQVNHKDSNKKNNYYKNLEWCTNSENQIHAHQNSIINHNPIKGEECNLAKYKDSEIKKVRDCIKNGERGIDIARKFGMSKGFVSMIKNGKRRT